MSRWSDRPPSPQREDGGNNNSRDSDHGRDRPPPDEPVVGDVYNGKISSIMRFGCFVQLEGLRSASWTSHVAVLSFGSSVTFFWWLRGRKRWEGLVHTSELRREGRIANVADVVTRGQRVKVKVLSFTGTKASLSMKVRISYTSLN